MKLLGGFELSSRVVPSCSVFNAENDEVGMAAVGPLGKQFVVGKWRRLPSNCHVICVPGCTEVHVVESTVGVGSVQNDLCGPSGVSVYLSIFK